MPKCLSTEHIEALVRGTLSARRLSAAQRHIATCTPCATALDEARDNEAWLTRMLDHAEVGELRRRIDQTASGVTRPGTALTRPPRTG